MSITLKIDFYCDDCDEFEPDIKKSEQYVRDNMFLGTFKTLRNTVIRCKHRNRCKAIYDKALEKTKEVTE